MTIQFKYTWTGINVCTRVTRNAERAFGKSGFQTRETRLEFPERYQTWPILTDGEESSCFLLAYPLVVGISAVCGRHIRCLWVTCSLVMHQCGILSRRVPGRYLYLCPPLFRNLSRKLRVSQTRLVVFPNVPFETRFKIPSHVSRNPACDSGPVASQLIPEMKKAIIEDIQNFIYS